MIVEKRIEKFFRKSFENLRVSRALRIPLAIPIQFENQGEKFQEKTINVSMGGMFIKTNHYIRPGSQIKLEFKLHPLETIKASAKVVWASEGVKGNEFSYTRGIGIQFTQLPTKAIIQLQCLTQEFKYFP